MKHALINQHRVWASWKISRRWWNSWQEQKRKTLMKVEGGLYFSFSFAASGWLHLWLHVIKKKQKKQSFSHFCWLRTKPSSSSSIRQLQLLGVSSAISANNGSIFVPCSITAVLKAKRGDQLCLRSLGITDICTSGDGKTSHGHWVKLPQEQVSFNSDKKKRYANAHKCYNSCNICFVAIFLCIQAQKSTFPKRLHITLTQICVHFLFVHNEHDLKEGWRTLSRSEWLFSRGGVSGKNNSVLKPFPANLIPLHTFDFGTIVRRSTPTPWCRSWGRPAAFDRNSMAWFLDNRVCTQCIVWIFRFRVSYACSS